jgi:hypothetical protein
MKTETQLKNNRKATYTLVTTALIAALLLAGTIVVQARPNGGPKPGVDFSGPHFNLNIHGVPTGIDKFDNDSIGSGRHSIFVPLSAEEGFSIKYAFSYTLNWTVFDCDATGDGTVSIILPAYMYLDTNGDGVEDSKTRVSYYMVYLAGLGKPADDSLVIVEPTAAYNASWTAFQLNQDHLEVKGHRKGPPRWYNGTDLFFADVTFFNGTDYTDYIDQWIFDIPGLEGYWWRMTNNGVKLMQVRFYPVLK